MYWVAVVPSGGLQLSDDGRSATMAMHNLTVIDQPAWPDHGATATPATISFRISWRATDEPAQINDAGKHFRFTGWRATAQLEAEVTVPSLGYSWKSDPLETSSSAFGVIGEEVNGKYFDQ